MLGYRIWINLDTWDDQLWPYDPLAARADCCRLGGRVQEGDLWLDFWIPQQQQMFWQIMYPGMDTITAGDRSE